VVGAGLGAVVEAEGSAEGVDVGLDEGSRVGLYHAEKKNND
jgi:hypothetical protein